VYQPQYLDAATYQNIIAGNGSQRGGMGSNGGQRGGAGGNGGRRW